MLPKHWSWVRFGNMSLSYTDVQGSLSMNWRPKIRLVSTLLPFFLACINFIILLFVFQFISFSFLVYTAFPCLCVFPENRNNPSVYKSEGAFWAPSLCLSFLVGLYFILFYFLVSSGSVWRTNHALYGFICFHGWKCVLVTDSNFLIIEWQIIFLIVGFMLDKVFLKGMYFSGLPTSRISFPFLSSLAQKS